MEKSISRFKNKLRQGYIFIEGLKKRHLVILFLTSNLQILTSDFSYGQTLDEYLQIAAENNPELQAYFSDYLAAMEKIPQVGTLPDPELSIGFFIQSMDRFMGRQQADIQLMQMFPWFGTLRTRKDEASKMALAQYEVFQDAKNRLLYQVKSTWYGMYRLEEEIRITEENLDILQTYERLALIRFQSGGSTGTGSGSMQNDNTTGNPSSPASSSAMGKMKNSMNMGNNRGTNSPSNAAPSMGSSTSFMNAGKSGMSDVLRVRMEIKELENTLALLKDSRSSLQVEFNQLLNRDYHEAVIVADTLAAQALTMDRLALLDSITLNNPMLKMLDAETEAYEAQQQMAQLEGRPMLGAGVSYMPFSPRMEDGMSMGGKDMIMPMVRVSIPIYRKKYNAMQKEAALRQQAVQQRKENTVNQLATQWSSTLRDLDDATRRINLYQEQADLARQTLNLLMTSYSSSGQDFEEVLSVQQQLLDYQLQLITAIVDQHTAEAMLEMMAATALDE